MSENKAILILRELNGDEKLRYLSEMREKALHDEASAINAAEKKGIEKGIEKEREKLIAKWKSRGFTDEQIRDLLEE